MTDEEIKQLLDKAANPHLVASAKEATKLMADLNALLSHLRLEFDALELKVDFANDQLYDELKAQGKTEQYIKNKQRISDTYQELRSKKSKLRDLRAIRKNLDKHKELLVQQEMYRPRSLPSGGERYGV